MIVRFFLCLSVMACSQTDIGSLHSAIYGGAQETASPWAVAVVNFDRGAGGGLCTGTLLDPEVVLTAKHCVWHDTGGGSYAATPYENITIRVGVNVMNAIEQEVGVREIRSTAGDYTVARIRDGDDIALILLDAPITGITSPGWAAAFPSVGQAADIVGYGFSSDSSDVVGVKYRGTTEVAEVGDWLIRTLGDSWTCQGDSGGPILVGGNVVGVTSAGRGGCERDAEHYYTALAPHQALLEDVLGTAPVVDAGAPPSTSDAGAMMMTMDGPPARDDGCSASGRPKGMAFPAVMLALWQLRKRRLKG